MADLLNKIKKAITFFKKDEPDDAEPVSTEDRVLRETSYIGDLDFLKAQGTRFILPVGLAISKYVKIGKNCTLYQNVTIGGKDLPNRSNNAAKYPQIGDNVTIYPGAFIVGGVKIGNNCIIGANTVIVRDVPDNAMASGNPAQIIPRG